MGYRVYHQNQCAHGGQEHASQNTEYEVKGAGGERIALDRLRGFNGWILVQKTPLAGDDAAAHAQQGLAEGHLEPFL